MGASELAFPEGSPGARYTAAYREWLGVEPAAAPSAAPARPRPGDAGDEDLDVGAPVELVVLAPKKRVARCRLLGTQREITLRSGDVQRLVPAEIVAVRARKQGQQAGRPYISGHVEAHRLDAAALGLVPLRLHDRWMWDPADEYWGEENEPIPDWARPIIARGPRPSFEMEQVLPGAARHGFYRDPILEAIDVRAAGDAQAAQQRLLVLLAADLRCLDAHAHLGNFTFDRHPEKAVRHYEAGVRIGELSLGADFDGVLPWGRINNRPFLRCMQGLALGLWRLGRPDEAAALCERMLWFNPADNQGVRFVLPAVRAGERWEDQGES